MLHRYLLTCLLILTFGLSQLGLLAHDVSHINSNPAQYTQINISQAQAHATDVAQAPLVSIENAVPDNQNQPDQHICEKCIGFAGITIAMQHAPLIFNIAALPEAHAHYKKYISRNLSLPTRSARAPPLNLV